MRILTKYLLQLLYLNNIPSQITNSNFKHSIQISMHRDLWLDVPHTNIRDHKSSWYLYALITIAMLLKMKDFRLYIRSVSCQISRFYFDMLAMFLLFINKYQLMESICVRTDQMWKTTKNDHSHKSGFFYCTMCIW